MKRSSVLVLTAVLLAFFLIGTGFAPAPPKAQNAPAEEAPPKVQNTPAKEESPEISPEELSLGAASPSRESSNTIVLKKSSQGFVSWALQGPVGWFPPPEQRYTGLLGPDPLSIRIILRCFAVKEFPLENTTYVPVELAFESAAGSFTFRNELLPGRYKKQFVFNFDGREKAVTLYFRVLKEEGPVLLMDRHGLDFGTVESGKTVNRIIHIRNPGRGVLSWKAVQPPPSLKDGTYVSLFNSDVSDNEPYSLPAHLHEMVQLQGEWTGVEGKPLGKPDSSMQINFTGTGIIVYGVKDSDPGLLNVKLDDDTTEDIPCGSGYLESTEIVILNGLPEGPHKLVLTRTDGILFAEGFKVLGSGALKGPANWMKIVPDSGTTTGETDFVNVTINTAGLTPGVYADEIDIISNSGRAAVYTSVGVNVSSIPQIIKIHRFMRGRDVLYSCNPAAESPRKIKGYAGKAYAFSLFREGTAGTRPLYRWFNKSNANHYYTTSREGDKFTRGYVLEGPIGNIATTRLPGTHELYHWYDPASGTHSFTLDPKGGNLTKARFVYQGIVGYVK